VRLWITTHGMPIDEVIHTLSGRRSGKIPASLAMTHARAIAATAQRMIARSQGR